MQWVKICPSSCSYIWSVVKIPGHSLNQNQNTNMCAKYKQ